MRDIAATAQRQLDEALQLLKQVRTDVIRYAAERDRYRAALEAIATFCDGPDWEHEWESDGDEHAIRWYTVCHGRDTVRAMVSDAMGEETK